MTEVDLVSARDKINDRVTTSCDCGSGSLLCCATFSDSVVVEHVGTTITRQGIGAEVTSNGVSLHHP